MSTFFVEDYNDPSHDGCWNCGGEGYVYLCVSEYECLDPETGCEQCERVCPVCRPEKAFAKLLKFAKPVFLSIAITFAAPVFGKILNDINRDVFSFLDGEALARELHESRDRKILQRLLGVDPVRVKWCGALAAHEVRKRGVKPPPSYLSVKAWKRWGRAVKPRPGVIVAFRHSHVGVLVSLSQNCLLVKSGNDGNRLRTRCRNPKTVQSYRWVK